MTTDYIYWWFVAVLSVFQWGGGGLAPIGGVEGFLHVCAKKPVVSSSIRGATELNWTELSNVVLSNERSHWPLCEVGNMSELAVMWQAEERGCVQGRGGKHSQKKASYCFHFYILQKLNMLITAEQIQKLCESQVDSLRNTKVEVTDPKQDIKYANSLPKHLLSCVWLIYCWISPCLLKSSIVYHPA